MKTNLNIVLGSHNSPT